nr:hypothetical protein [Candidatus Sigynarchaeota archaeon]
MASPGPLSTWYHVRFDENGITRDVHPGDKEPWSDFVPWAKIIRICFKTAEDLMFSDEIYIFTSDRTESYLIPTEADGGAELWNEIIKRGLFDAELAIKAATAPEDSLFCWPPPP